MFGFGSSGGGELFAFEYRDVRAGRILTVPLIPLDLREAGVIADNFGEFAVSVGVPMTTQPQMPVASGAFGGSIPDTDHSLKRKNQAQEKGVPKGVPNPNSQPCVRNRPYVIGRGEKIRTSDPLHPMQVRYQAAPRPDRMRMIAEIWIERFAAPLAAHDATG
jgi:hypothetical protein